MLAMVPGHAASPALRNNKHRLFVQSAASNVYFLQSEQESPQVLFASGLSFSL